LKQKKQEIIIAWLMNLSSPKWHDRHNKCLEGKLGGNQETFWVPRGWVSLFLLVLLSWYLSNLVEVPLIEHDCQAKVKLQAWFWCNRWIADTLAPRNKVPLQKLCSLQSKSDNDLLFIMFRNSQIVSSVQFLIH